MEAENIVRATLLSVNWNQNFWRSNYVGRSSSKVSYFFKKNYSPQEAENAVISQRNHPVDIHIFHNAHATIAWP